MFERAVVPEELDTMSPGVGLATVLDGIDITRCVSKDLFTVAKAWGRYLSYVNAQMLRVSLETAWAEAADRAPSHGREVYYNGETGPDAGVSGSDYGSEDTVPDDDSDTADDTSTATPAGGGDGGGDGSGRVRRVRVLDEFSGDQLAFALHCSRSTSGRQISLAHDLLDRLPAVFDALETGRIDIARARAISEALVDVSDTVARDIAEGLLDKATYLTPTKLRERIRYRVQRREPDAVRHRYMRAVTDRRVYKQLFTDGTAQLGAENLPPDRAAAAVNRIDRLARAAKHSGDARNLAQLRADAMLDLIAGRPFQLTPSISRLTQQADDAARAERHGQNPAEDPAYPLPDGERRHRPGLLPARTNRTPASPRGHGVIAPDTRPPKPAKTTRPHTNTSTGTATGTGAGTGRDSRVGVDNSDGFWATEDLTHPDFWPTPNNAATPQPTPEPADLSRPDPNPDQNPEPIPDPRHQTDAENSGQYRLDGEPNPDWIAETDCEPHPDDPHHHPHNTNNDDDTDNDDDGESKVFEVACDHPKACVCGGIQPAPRRGVVDLQAQLTTIMSLNDNPALIPGWGIILADIARDIAHDQENNPAWTFSATDNHGNLLHHKDIKRRPDTTERAFVTARDQQCISPGCTHPANTCDQDHRTEWANHGPTHRGNLETICNHHHRLRHQHHYTIHLVPGGGYLWKAPNGCTYLTPPDEPLRLTIEGQGNPIHLDELITDWPDSVTPTTQPDWQYLHLLDTPDE